VHFFGGKITITAILYVLFAFTPITYVTLLVAVILLTTSIPFRRKRSKRTGFADGN
jgi:hypothetical protein